MNFIKLFTAVLGVLLMFVLLSMSIIGDNCSFKPMTLFTRDNYFGKSDLIAMKGTSCSVKPCHRTVNIHDETKTTNTSKELETGENQKRYLSGDEIKSVLSKIQLQFDAMKIESEAILTDLDHMITVNPYQYSTGGHNSSTNAMNDFKTFRAYSDTTLYFLNKSVCGLRISQYDQLVSNRLNTAVHLQFDDKYTNAYKRLINVYTARKKRKIVMNLRRAKLLTLMMVNKGLEKYKILNIGTRNMGRYANSHRTLTSEMTSLRRSGNKRQKQGIRYKHE